MIAILSGYTPAQIATLLHISDPLAQLNANRYAQWQQQHTTKNARQACFAFNGDVYQGLNACTLTSAALNYAQQHIVILSGLYGALRPLDLIQPYRLDMGTKLSNPHGANLYHYWSAAITSFLRQLLTQSKKKRVINLASEEYFKVVQRHALAYPIITPIFQEYRRNRYSVISFYAKRARGLMARFASTHQISDPNLLKTFDEEDYCFDSACSSEQRWIFKRG